MRSLHIIMPMGGFGSRFKNKGINCPKPLINVDGIPMFLRSIKSFDKLDCPKKYTFIVRFDHNQEYNIIDKIKEYIPSANFIILTENTRGATETCLKAVPYIAETDSIIILDCDLEFNAEQYFKEIKEDLNKDIKDCTIAGRLVSFLSVNPRYSYAKINNDNIVLETAEKNPISNHAITGSYYFLSKEIFLTAALRLMYDFENKNIDIKEPYLSLLYNNIIKSNLKVKLYSLDLYNSFGTPEELEQYLKKISIKVAGHSGCIINIKNENNNYIVEKITTKKSYFDRLEKQILKQINFYDNNLYKNIATPQVFNLLKTDTTCTAIMEYINGDSFIDYFENCTEDQKNIFINEIINFINKELELSHIEKINYIIFLNKFMSVKNNILNNSILNTDQQILDLLDKYEEIFKIEQEYEIPVGICHGDLTLSNILFKNEKYYFIDFLDSFIETPFMDIVKLRQDTKYNWSYLLANKQKLVFDKSKSILLDIDTKIFNYYKNNVYFKKSYNILQYMNFLRILQYANDPIIIEYLKNVLISFLIDYEINF